MATDISKERFYGRRKGRPLRAGMQNLVNDLLPKIQITGTSGAVDPAGIFSHPDRPLWLEIGFGAGEHLAWQAAHHRDVNFIGCEPYINGVARLLTDVRDKSLNNIRICPDDARPLLDALPDRSVSRAFVLFADPWPKKRHNNRRMIGPENLRRLSRLLKDRALLRVASDHADYVRWILRHTLQNGDFIWLDEGPGNWFQREEDWPPTRYETKALAGRPYYLRFQRKAR